MSEQWLPLPLDKPLFANLDEDAVVGYQTAIENGFVNELGGHSRFPGLKPFVTLAGNARVYLHDINGDLVAATSQGQVYVIDETGNATNITAVPVAGGRRVVFARTQQDLLMAAGGPIVRLRNRVTELLSPNAPISTHIAWIDNFTIAVQINSGLFFYSVAGEPDNWDPLDSFAADGIPENITSLIVTPFRELYLGQPDGIEQFLRMPTGNVPFYRNFAVGDGVKLPYAIVFADNSLYFLNNMTEMVKFSGQTSKSVSETIGRLLEAIDDFSDAWIGGYPDRALNLFGQKFLILQFPNATNPYGTKGLTLLFDYRRNTFSSLYGWDTGNGVPARYPAWSHWTLWNRHFVGGEGKIYELTEDTFYQSGALARWLVRTSHIASGNAALIKQFRLQLKRGLGDSNAAPSQVRVRCSRDGKPFGSWITRTLGKAGERLQFIEFGCFGTASHFQFELSSTDDCAVQLVKAEVKTDPIGM
jgi:hypothetical protein